MSDFKKEGFYNVEDIQSFLGCKETLAYKIIRRLNNELEEKGYITVPGKVSAPYFNKRYYGVPEDIVS